MNSQYKNSVSNFWELYAKKASANIQLLRNAIIMEINKIIGDNPIIGLDYGCGSGDDTYEIAKLGYQMYGYDNSDDQMNKAKKNKHQNLFFISDLNEVTESSINFVMFKFSICTMSDKVTNIALIESLKKLKKGGKIIIGEQNRDNCIGKETMCERYPAEENTINGKKRKTYLKIGGRKMSDGLIQGIDYEIVNDHYREYEYLKGMLETAGFINVCTSLPKLEKDLDRVPMDEGNTAVYRIITALKP